MRLFLFLISLSMFADTLRVWDIPEKTKLSIQIAELEMQLVSSQFENTKLVQKELETKFRISQAKLTELQTGACKLAGGKKKEDCNFTLDTVTLKPPIVEEKK